VAPGQQANTPVMSLQKALVLGFCSKTFTRTLHPYEHDQGLRTHACREGGGWSRTSNQQELGGVVQRQLRRCWVLSDGTMPQQCAACLTPWCTHGQLPS